ITPTVCSLLGIGVPGHVQGQDLSPYFGEKPPASQERHLYCESLTPTTYDASPLVGVVTNQWKYIQTTRPELYNILDDPGESKNLAEQQAGQTHILQNRLRQILEQTAGADSSSSKIELDEQALKRLRSLGYMAGNIREDFKFDQSGDDPKDLIDFHNFYTSVSDLILQKEYEQAEGLCQKLASQRPQVYHIYVLMASIAREQQDFDRAVLHLKRAIEVRPDVAKLQHYLGTILSEQGKFEEAAEHLQKSLRIDPDQLAVHHELAAVFYRQKKFDQAIVHLSEALRLKPDSVKTVSRLGDAYAEKGNFRQAIGYFQQALDMNPSDGENRSKLAQTLAFQGRHDEAIEQLKNGIGIMLKHGREEDAARLQEQLHVIEGKSIIRE
ncbi:MAG: tetratricopeptide repeat protein, partial [Planctomycetota bacterium]